MEGFERFDVTVNVTGAHQPRIFGEFFGLPASAFQVGESIHVLRSAVELDTAAKADVTVEEALGVNYVAD
jgi:hypothetical protein